MAERLLHIVAVSVLLIVGGATAAQAVVLGAGNRVYSIGISDDQFLFRCATWTALTASSHPLGAGKNLLFSSAGPGTLLPASSYTSLRSWDTGRNYQTGALNISSCSWACDVGSVEFEPVLREGFAVGYRFVFTFVDTLGQGRLRAGTDPTIQFIQEVVVEGPVDGTETVENSSIRETHIVRNLGPAPFTFGLRKLWDVQIDPDFEPWFGDCDLPTDGCDRSMSLTEDGSRDGFYPRNWIGVSDPSSVTCPSGIVPNEPNGCGFETGPYVVAGTVSGPSLLDPPPTPPEVLQFNSWNLLFGECWTEDLFDAAACGTGGPFDETAIAYFWGFTEETAIVLLAGDERSFTQYLVAEAVDCPTTITDGDDDGGTDPGGPDPPDDESDDESDDEGDDEGDDGTDDEGDDEPWDVSPFHAAEPAPDQPHGRPGEGDDDVPSPGSLGNGQDPYDVAPTPFVHDGPGRQRHGRPGEREESGAEQGEGPLAGPDEGSGGDQPWAADPDPPIQPAEPAPERPRGRPGTARENDGSP